MLLILKKTLARKYVVNFWLMGYAFILGVESIILWREKDHQSCHFISLHLASQVPKYRGIFVCLWDHRLCIYGVKIFILIITKDTDLDGTTESRSRILVFWAFIKPAGCKVSNSTNKMLSTFKWHSPLFPSRDRKVPAKTVCPWQHVI